MEHRRCGRTRVKLPIIGFGSMRMHGDDFEHWASIVREAMEAGFTYIDAGNNYNAHTNEIKVGMGIKGFPRDKVVLSTKCMGRQHPTADDARRAIDDSMKKLDVDYLDFYQMWSLSVKEFTGTSGIKGGTLDGIRKAMDEGLIRHLGLTCHDKPENAIELLRTGEFEAITLQYNLLDRRNEEVVAEAGRLGIGVVVMGPLKGGILACDSPLVREVMGDDIESTEEAAFRFVLSNPNVTCAISGMLTSEEIQKDRRIAERFRPFTAAERDRADAALAGLKLDADKLCTGCRYCMPCPEGVGISEVFRLANAARIYGLVDGARHDYALFDVDWPYENWKDASHCTECGECLDKCPQKIKIPEALKEAHDILK
ncbi:MAG TPA: aldo/keto reductase [Planctomycetota bacterium]|nr:aldo/keto reductase [Planctomycetota bacterium]